MEDLIYNFLNIRAAGVAIPFILRGVSVTLQVSIVSIVLASALGLMITLLRRALPRYVRWVLVVYTDLFRGIPPVMLMILVYFGLPSVRVDLPVFHAAVVSLTLYGGAYAAEIFRGAFEGVPAGQWDAARALGLTASQAMRQVILPQAFRIAIPPLTNQAIALVKLTSVGFVIGLQELLGQARQAQELTANMTPLMAGAFAYLALVLILSKFSRAIESRSKSGVLQAAA